MVNRGHGLKDRKKAKDPQARGPTWYPGGPCRRGIKASGFPPLSHSCFLIVDMWTDRTCFIHLQAEHQVPKGEE